MTAVPALAVVTNSSMANLASCAAVTLGDLAQARPAFVEALPQQQLQVRIARGLMLQDTQQELRLGDTPQVANYSQQYCV